MSPEDIAAARARCDAATPGPWRAEGISIGRLWGPDFELGIFDLGRHEVEFIAHARADLPAALDALAASQAECEKLRETLRYIAEHSVGFAAKNAARSALGEDT